MAPLRRHQLAYLSDAGWALVQARPWDAQAADCLAHWAAHCLPLVVTRQPTLDAAEPTVALGLPAPAPWGRRRLSLQVPRSALLRLGEFPLATEVLDLVPPQAQAAWRTLAGSLSAAGTTAHVYGSMGWQHLSGLPCLRDTSDIDLWVAVTDADHADLVAGLLRGYTADGPRLDGELVFADGAAVAWREWLAWRAGQARQLLVRRLHGPALMDEPLPPRAAGVGERAA